MLQQRYDRHCFAVVVIFSPVDAAEHSTVDGRRLQVILLKDGRCQVVSTRGCACDVTAGLDGQTSHKMFATRQPARPSLSLRARRLPTR